MASGDAFGVRHVHSGDEVEDSGREGVVAIAYDHVTGIGDIDEPGMGD
jgi:hypothetical protein